MQQAQNRWWLCGNAGTCSFLFLCVVISVESFEIKVHESMSLLRETFLCEVALNSVPGEYYLCVILCRNATLWCYFCLNQNASVYSQVPSYVFTSDI